MKFSTIALLGAAIFLADMTVGKEGKKDKMDKEDKMDKKDKMMEMIQRAYCEAMPYEADGMTFSEDVSGRVTLSQMVDGDDEGESEGGAVIDVNGEIGDDDAETEEAEMPQTDSTDIVSPDSL